MYLLLSLASSLLSATVLSLAAMASGVPSLQLLASNPATTSTISARPCTYPPFPKLSPFGAYSFHPIHPRASRARPSSPSSPSPSEESDMERYLNDLSLEYESVWDTKPAWCQPWTIVLTGCVAVSMSWVTLRSMPVTALVASLIGAWWYVFLYSYPQAYITMIADRRRRVSNGEEDIYGFKSSDE